MLESDSGMACTVGSGVDCAVWVAKGWVAEVSGTHAASTMLKIRIKIIAKARLFITSPGTAPTYGGFTPNRYYTFYTIHVAARSKKNSRTVLCRHHLTQKASRQQVESTPRRPAPGC